MKIISWIIVIGLGLCNVVCIIFGVSVCLSLWKKRKKAWRECIRKYKKQFLVVFLVLAVSLGAFWGSVIGLCNIYKYLAKESIPDSNSELYSSQYLKIVQILPFHDELMNEEEIIWDHLVSKELLYGNYIEWKKQSNDFDKLRSKYSSIYEQIELPCVEIDELLEHVNAFYGSEILPITDSTLTEVDEELKQKPNIKAYQNEFWLRVTACDANSSGEQFYYIAVAADNVFKNLCNDKERNPSVKEVIFYGSMAIAFYLASEKYYEGSYDLILLYYRISEIYIYLDRYVDFGEDDAVYSEHFLLMAEIFLVLAKKEYEKSEESKDIHAHENITFFGQYYTEILYEFIVKYKSEDENLVSMCQGYARQYLDSPYTEEYTKARKSCEDILIRLEKSMAVE